MQKYQNVSFFGYCLLSLPRYCLTLCFAFLCIVLSSLTNVFAFSCLCASVLHCLTLCAVYICVLCFLLFFCICIYLDSCLSSILPCFLFVFILFSLGLSYLILSDLIICMCLCMCLSGLLAWHIILLQILSYLVQDFTHYFSHESRECCIIVILLKHCGERGDIQTANAFPPASLDHSSLPFTPYSSIPSLCFRIPIPLFLIPYLSFPVGYVFDLVYFPFTYLAVMQKAQNMPRMRYQSFFDVNTRSPASFPQTFPWASFSFSPLSPLFLPSFSSRQRPSIAAPIQVFSISLHFYVASNRTPHIKVVFPDSTMQGHRSPSLE